MKTLFEQIADLPAGSKPEDYELLGLKSGQKFSMQEYNKFCLDSNEFSLVQSRKPHPHAALMMQYALDAQETETPWDRWEYRDNFIEDWVCCMSTPSFSSNRLYRRKEQP